MDDESNLTEDFDTMTLLEAVDHIDEARGYLADGENLEPPEIRQGLMKLHGLAMEVVNEGQNEKAREMFDLAMDLDMQIDGIIEALRSAQEILAQLNTFDSEPP